MNQTNQPPEILFLGAEAGFEAVQDTVGPEARVVHVDASESALNNALAGAHAILDASMKVAISDEMVRRAANLRIISCATTGSDHIQRGELDRRRIPVRTLKEDRELLRNLTPAAELSWALVLACARNLPSACAHVRAGKWIREAFPGLMLRGKRLGLIGCGRIGGWLARYGSAFGMQVVGCDPHLEAFPADIEPVDLRTLMQTADVISVHVHLNAETRGLVSADLFEEIKPGAIFINTSRGAVIDEAALLKALQNGRIRAAGLDVVQGEPQIDDLPLVEYARTHDNLIITPHIGGFSPDAVRVVCARAAEKIMAHLGRF